MEGAVGVQVPDIGCLLHPGEESEILMIVAAPSVREELSVKFALLPSCQFCIGVHLLEKSPCGLISDLRSGEGS